MSEYSREFPRGRFFKESDSLGEDFFSEEIKNLSLKRNLNRFGEERFRYISSDKQQWPLDFSGLGPRNYERPEETILDEACEVLARDPYLDASDMAVELKEGTLILRGTVSTRRDKKRAEALVENIFGVEDVLNLLTMDRQVWRST